VRVSVIHFKRKIRIGRVELLSKDKLYYFELNSYV